MNKSVNDENALDFKQAFAILKHNAERLEDQQEPDLDQLMIIVEESMQAYKVCKQRIKSVQDALNQTFEHD
jgi:exodeoxyribonuclease VII small subunit